MSSSNSSATPQSGLTSPFRTPKDAVAILLAADGTPLPFANPTEPELWDAVKGYYYTSFRTLFPLKTTVVDIDNRATITTH